MSAPSVSEECKLLEFYLKIDLTVASAE